MNVRRAYPNRCQPPVTRQPNFDLPPPPPHYFCVCWGRGRHWGCITGTASSLCRCGISGPGAVGGQLGTDPAVPPPPRVITGPSHTDLRRRQQPLSNRRRTPAPEPFPSSGSPATSPRRGDPQGPPRCHCTMIWCMGPGHLSGGRAGDPAHRDLLMIPRLPCPRPSGLQSGTRFHHRPQSTQPPLCIRRTVPSWQCCPTAARPPPRAPPRSPPPWPPLCPPPPSACSQTGSLRERISQEGSNSPGQRGLFTFRSGPAASVPGAGRILF